jgi:hypothetical protein
MKPTAHISFDSTDFKTEAEKAVLAALEVKLYGKVEGSTTTKAELPMPDTLIEMMAAPQ